MPAPIEMKSFSFSSDIISPMKNFKTVLFVVVVVVFLCGLVAMLPPIRDRIAYRVDLVRNRIEYTFFPPTEEIFVPQGQQAVAAVATLETAAPPAAETPTPIPPATLLPTVPTSTPGPTATPLPSQIILQGVRYEDQHGLWNYCAPATLSMALSYWGWEGTRLDTGKYLKPFDLDLNVMPYEMADYVADRTNLTAALRSGGTLTLLQKLAASGFPVVIEKGVMIKETSTGIVTWMGHYNLVVGYDDVTREVIVRDAYYSPPNYPLDYRIPYDQLMQEWQNFNYVFLVIYPPERQNDVYNLLGDYANENAASQIAFQKASDEVYTSSGVDTFFAWYNRGTNQVALQDYYGAAQSYDEAFKYLASMPKDLVPPKIMRMVWYQTGPYFAYYYSGRYQDVIDLAKQALALPTQGPYLEESFYWRAQAEIALGDKQSAVDDLGKSLEYHPGFSPSVNLMNQLGVSP